MKFSTVGYPEANPTEPTSSYVLGTFYGNTDYQSDHSKAFTIPGGGVAPIVAYGGRSSSNPSLDVACAATSWILDDNNKIATRWCPSTFARVVTTASVYADGGAADAGLGSGNTGFVVFIQDRNNDLGGKSWPMAEVTIGKINNPSSGRAVIEPGDFNLGVHYPNLLGTGIAVTLFSVADAVPGVGDFEFDIADQGGGLLTSIIVGGLNIVGTGSGSNNIIDSGTII